MENTPEWPDQPDPDKWLKDAAEGDEQLLKLMQLQERLFELGAEAGGGGRNPDLKIVMDSISQQIRQIKEQKDRQLGHDIPLDPPPDDKL